MPAIHLPRLNRQIAELIPLFDQPERFRRALHDLFEAYHDRTFRSGQTGRPPPLLPHYNVPLPVIRKVENEVSRLTQADKQSALSLADALWADTHLELRLLAVLILSQIPLDPPDPVMDRLSLWARPDEDKQVLQALLTQGTTQLIRQQPEQWAAMSRDWLTHQNPAVQAMGLHALLATASDPDFEDLPSIFRLISPLVQAPQDKLQGDLLTLLSHLAQRSPRETAYFLRQVVTINATPRVQRLFRRCLPFFSEEIQTNLRGALYKRPN
jgi:hypothetical protein